MKLPLFFLVLMLVTQLSAQSRTTLSQDASSLWQNAQVIYASPLHYTRSQWLTVAGVLSLTTGSHFLDESTRSFALAHQTSTLKALFSIGEFYGNPICAGLIGSGLYLGGHLGSDTSTRLTGRAVMESVLYAALLTQVLKLSLGRSRPYQNKGARDFNGLSWTNDKLSLPSGHTTIAFAMSASLSVRLKRPAVTVGLFTLALLTTGHRIYDDQHWLSDTLFGAAIGTSIGLAVGNLINRSASQPLSPSPESQPIFSVQLPL